jgi:hypothetical protein
MAMTNEQEARIKAKAHEITAKWAQVLLGVSRHNGTLLASDIATAMAEEVLTDSATLRTQLEAMERERDELKKKWHYMATCDPDVDIVDENIQLKSQLAAALAGVADLQQQLQAQYRERGLDMRASDITVDKLLRAQAERDSLQQTVARVEGERTKIQTDFRDYLADRNGNIYEQIKELIAHVDASTAERDTLAVRCGALEKVLLEFLSHYTDPKYTYLEFQNPLVPTRLIAKAQHALLPPPSTPSTTGSAHGYSGPSILSSSPLTPSDIKLGREIAERYGLLDPPSTPGQET